MSEMEFFKYLDLEETFGRLCSIFQKKWSFFLGITAIAYLVIEAVTVASLTAFLPVIVNYLSNQSYNNDSTQYFIRYIILQILDSAIYFGIMCIGDGAIIRAVAEMYVGRFPAVLSTLQWGFFKSGPLFGVSVLVGVVIGVPVASVLFFVVEASGMMFTVFALALVSALACVCFSAWILVITYHAYPSIVVENHGILQSVSRSLELSSGQRSYIFTRLSVLFLVKGALKRIFQLTGEDGSEGVVLFSKALIMILNVFFGSFSSM